MIPRQVGDLNTMGPLVRYSTGKAIRWAVIRIHFKINFHSSPSSPQNPSTTTFSGCCFCASPTGPDRCYANYLYKTHDREADVQAPHSFSDKGCKCSYNCNNSMADALKCEVAENIKPLVF
jgi:hypothetical protein